MATRVHHHRSFFGSFFAPRPHDYIMRNRRSRVISNVVMITLFSLLLAWVILYTSNPGGVAPLAR